MMSDEEMISCTEPFKQLDRLRAIMRRLRGKDGCPWDAEQTHQSLIPNMIEESYEAIDAILREDWPHLKEELGDVLLQVVFHAQISSDQGRFDLDDIARELSDKLIRRHPHIFADSQISHSDGVISQWEQIKREEKGTQKKPYLHDTGKGLPGMLKAYKLQKKAARVGFDWPDLNGVVDKIREELAEVEDTFNLPDDHPESANELGDLLFAVVNLCRKRRIDPEVALALTNRKFEERFTKMESLLDEKGSPLGTAPLDEMEQCWQQAKSFEQGIR